MRHITVSLVLCLALLSGCVPVKAPDFPEPAIRDWSETVSWNKATLTASFENAEGIRECGFCLSAPGAEYVKVPVEIVGSTITYEWTGLSASTDYVWWVYYTNGLDEAEVRSRSFTTEKEPYDPVLWAYLLDSFDNDGDKALSESETADIKAIELFGVGMKSLSGIDVLGNLEELHMARNGIERIDVSSLDHLIALYVSEEICLRVLVLDNPRLYLSSIAGPCPSLDNVDYSHCPDLGIVGIRNLDIPFIDFSNNSRMYLLQLYGSAMKEVDLSASPIFERLVLKDNPLLETVWLRTGTSLTECDIEPHNIIRYK